MSEEEENEEKKEPPISQTTMYVALAVVWVIALLAGFVKGFPLSELDPSTGLAITAVLTVVILFSNDIINMIFS